MTDLERKLRATRPNASDKLRQQVQEIATRPQTKRFSLHLPAPRQLALGAASAFVIATFAAAVALTANTHATQTAHQGGVSLLSASHTQAGTGSKGAWTKGSPGALNDQNSGNSPTIPISKRPQQVGANLTVQVPNLDHLSAATQKVFTIVQNLGGWPQSVNYSTGKNGGSCTPSPIYENAAGVQSSLSDNIIIAPCESVYRRAGAAIIDVSVPRAHFNEAYSELSALGRIVSQQLNVQDLGQSNSDLGTQIKQLKNRLGKLQQELAASGLSSAERLMLRREADSDAQSLTQLREQLKQNGTSARYSTISLTLQTPAKAAPRPVQHGRAHKVFVKALDILIWQAVAVFWALVAIVPAAIVVTLACLSGRQLRRRREQKLLD